jgi:two-component system OmpR family response regulator
MSDGPHILIVDDDPDIRDLLSGFLGRHGHRVHTAAEGRAMFEALETWAVDLVVLDLMLPGDDGLTLCRRLRQVSDVPVIMLTAMGEPTDRVVGLELGADDYVPKPCQPRELLARIRAVLRRRQSAGSAARERGTGVYAFAGFRLDAGGRTLTDSAGRAIDLTSGEFALLKVLLERPQRVLSREHLLDLTRGREAASFDRSIDSQISRLRRKIEADPGRPRLIKTVRSAGYVFAGDVRRDGHGGAG